MEENLTVIDVSQMMAVKQLPVIQEELRALKDKIQERTKIACSLSCTAETVKEVKRIRAELNKERSAAEAARKSIKAQIMKPYEDFEAVYRECISDAYNAADQQLKTMINDTEGQLKERKRLALYSYYTEHAAAAGLDIGTWPFERTGIEIRLSASDASLKREADAWIDQRRADLEAIDGMEGADEILAEYIKAPDLARAVQAVKARREALERARAQREARQKEEAARQEKAQEIAAQMPQEAPAPVPVPEEEEPQEEAQLFVRFTVWGTRAQLKALKQFLTEGGYRYE